MLKYKAQMIRKGLKEATVNRRLAALKSLVVTGRKLGVCDFSLEDVESERVQKYRDTSGIDQATFEVSTSAIYPLPRVSVTMPYSGCFGGML